MKKLLYILPILFFSCSKSTNEVTPDTPSIAGTYIVDMPAKEVRASGVTNPFTLIITFPDKAGQPIKTIERYQEDGENFDFEYTLDKVSVTGDQITAYGDFTETMQSGHVSKWRNTLIVELEKGVYKATYRQLYSTETFDYSHTGILIPSR